MIESLPIIFAIFTFITFVLLVWIVRLDSRLKKVLLGKDAKTLEDSFVHLKKEIDLLNTFQKESENYFLLVENRLKRSLQGIETVRFNAFKGDGLGGNQSFATAFLNEQGDGVVLSSLYTRERTSIFAKSIKNFTSAIELSEEEQEAITKSKEQLKRKG